MMEPSSLSWSNHYDLEHSGMQTSLPQKQDKSLDGLSENEMRHRQQESQNEQMMDFHQTAEHRKGDLDGQEQSGRDQLHDYKSDSSLQPLNSRDDDIREARQVTWEDIMQVKHFVETCIKSYMTKNEIIKALSSHANIDPCFTHLVWQRLERENYDFFRKYYIWLKVKEQILLFNNLLEQQHQLMVMESALDFQQPQPQTSLQPHVVSSELASHLTQQSSDSSHGRLKTDSKVYRVMEVPISMQSSLFDSSPMSNVNVSQGSAMFGSEAFFSNPSMISGTPFTACNMVDLNGDGFLHMGSLEGMPGYFGQSTMNRNVSDFSTVFPNNQGSFSGPSFLSSNMETIMNTPFQNTGEDRTVAPITDPAYDSYGDKDLEDYMHMVQRRQQ